VKNEGRKRESNSAKERDDFRETTSVKKILQKSIERERLCRERGTLFLKPDQRKSTSSDSNLRSVFEADHTFVELPQSVRI